MKKLIAIVTMMAGASALAVDSNNVFGILRVDSTEQETIVSVPWIAADAEVKNIQVCDLVLTSNLNAGDRLYYYDGKSSFLYKLWVLTVDAEGNKTWEATTGVSGKDPANQKISVSEANATLQIPRGGALFIVRETHTEPIYLYGRYTNTPVSTQVQKGTSSTQRAYTLLAPTGPNGIDLNTPGIITAGTVKRGDFIQLQSGVALTYKNGQWGVNRGWDETSQKNVFDTSSTYTTIPHGQGCWYVSCGGDPTFTW